MILIQLTTSTIIQHQNVIIILIQTSTIKLCLLNGLSFIPFNARSLKANLQKIKDYLQELHLKFDIIAVSETWAELAIIDDLNLIDYSAYHVTRETRKSGGVALYIRNELTCRLLETKTIKVKNKFYNSRNILLVMMCIT